MTLDRSERALILAPHGRDALVALGMLAEAGFDGDVVSDVGQLVEELALGAGLGVVTAEAISTGSLHPLSRWLDEQPEWSDFPFVLLTRRGGGNGSGSATSAMSTSCCRGIAGRARTRRRS